MNLTRFRTLGRSGLVVSPLALGTMTFGNTTWGSPDEVSAEIFNAYVDAGGNFIDTADVYADGRSEELVGAYAAERKLRDRLVIATKVSFHDGDEANVNAGGNGRKNLHRALEGSLRRLRTDYVDLYWMHVWDRVTPYEEVLQSMDDLVRAGKIRYFGLSDVPAWYAAALAAAARARGVPGPVALQMPYSLAERGIEREHVPAAREFGMGVTPWSPLAAGFLSGKYRRAADGAAPAEGGRLTSGDPRFALFTERNWQTLDALRTVAEQIGRPPAHVALAWALARPAVASLIAGATTARHVRDNLASLDLELPPHAAAALDAASAAEPAWLYTMFGDDVNREGVFGGSTVAPHA